MPGRRHKAPWVGWRRRPSGPRFDTSSGPPNYPLSPFNGAAWRPRMDAATFTVTERAAQRIAQILKGEAPESVLRVSVEGGGCSGFQYRFEIEGGGTAEDLTIERGSDRRGRSHLAAISDGFETGFLGRTDRGGLSGGQSERHRFLRLRHELRALSRADDAALAFFRVRTFFSAPSRAVSLCLSPNTASMPYPSSRWRSWSSPRISSSSIPSRPSDSPTISRGAPSPIPSPSW
jgi:hypothetical protein